MSASVTDCVKAFCAELVLPVAEIIVDYRYDQ